MLKRETSPSEMDLNRHIQAMENQIQSLYSQLVDIRQDKDDLVTYYEEMLSELRDQIEGLKKASGQDTKP